MDLFPNLSPAARVARAQGIFNLLGGAWPIVWLRSFEWVYGPKQEDWLQKTSGGLLVASAIALLAAEDSPESMRTARHIGVGVALTYLLVDLVYIPQGRLRKTYLQDLLCEAGWLWAWMRADPDKRD
jgi:hypothetical protein